MLPAVLLIDDLIGRVPKNRRQWLRGSGFRFKDKVADAVFGQGGGKHLVHPGADGPVAGFVDAEFGGGVEGGHVLADGLDGLFHGGHFAAIGPLYLFHGFQSCLLFADLRFEGPVDGFVVGIQQLPDLLDGKAAQLQVLDLNEGQGLRFVVVSVAGEPIHPAGLQQLHPVIVPKRLGIAAA